MDKKIKEKCFENIIQKETIIVEPIKSYENLISASLEKYYIESMDFESLEKYTKEFCEEILK